MRVTLIILRFLLSAFFIVSAVAKLAPLELFELRLISDGFAGWSTARYVSVTIITIELLAGLSFWSPWSRRRLVYPFILAFLTVMTGVLIRQLITVGNDSDCGCFGDWFSMSPGWSLVKNSILMLLVIVLYRKDADMVNDKRYLIASLLFVLATFGLIQLIYPSANGNGNGIVGLNGAPASFAKEYEFNTGKVDLGKGEKIVAFLSAGCVHCKEMAMKLKILDERQEIPEIYFMIWGDEETIDEFFKTTQARYPYKSFSMQEFFAFREKGFPRIYRLNNGVITGQWDNKTFDGRGF